MNKRGFYSSLLAEGTQLDLGYLYEFGNAYGTGG